MSFFLSQQGGEGCVFAVFFAPIPEKEILDFIAHGSIIRVFTVVLRRCHQCCNEGGVDQKMIEGLELTFSNRGVIR